MPRAKQIKDTKSQTATIEYPGPEELNEPPENIEEYMICIYGKKGIGKTTAASSIPNSLTLMFEPKRKNLRIRQVSLQKHTAKEIMEGAPDLFQLVVNTTPEWIEDESINCLNYDSIDIFYEACYHHICASHEIEEPSEAGKNSHEIWNEIRDTFASYFDAIRDTNMGITFLSHFKEREEKDMEGGKMGFQAPSCSPACLRYIMQAVDIVLFYGVYNGKRAMMVRDPFDGSFVTPGVQGKFQQPNGKPINIFEIPDEPTEVFNTIKSAFNNELWDVDTDESDRTITKSKGAKKKVSKKKLR